MSVHISQENFVADYLIPIKSFQTKSYEYGREKSFLQMIWL
jgi:hypothetical protein